MDTNKDDVLGGLTETEQRFFDTGGEEAPEAEEYLEPTELAEPEPAPEPEPEPEPEPDELAATGEEEPEAEPEDQAAEEQGDDTVPHGRFHKERERRLAADAKAQALTDQVRRMEERFSEVVSRYAAPPATADAPAEEAEPDRETEPMAYLEHQIKKRDEQIAKLQQGQEQTAQTMSATQFSNWAKETEDRYAAAVPDYWGATQFVKETRAGHLKAMGYQDEQIPALLAQEAQSVALAGFHNKTNPADVIYKMAQSMGWQPKAPNGGDGHPEPTPEPSGAEKMTALQKRSRAATGLGGPGGDTPGGISLSDLAEMTDADFEQGWDKLVSRGGQH